MALPKENRLVKKSEIDQVLREGKAVKGSFLFIRTKKNEKGPRFVFLIPKSKFPKASERNRLRRILSEAAKRYIIDKPDLRYDVIVLLNKRTEEHSIYEDMSKTLEYICNPKQ